MKQSIFDAFTSASPPKNPTFKGILSRGKKVKKMNKERSKRSKRRRKERRESQKGSIVVTMR